MELKELVTLCRRWAWLLIIGTVAGLVGGFVANYIQTPVYESAAKVFITRNRQQSGADIFSINDQQLVLTYQQLLKTHPVISEAESRLGISINPEDVQVDVILNTQIIQIKVQGENPNQIASIANTLVQILIEQNETMQSGRYTLYEEGLNSQIDQVQSEIATLQGEIAQANKSNVEQQLDLVNKQIVDLQDEIVILEQEIAVFAGTSQAERASLAEKQSQIDQIWSLLYIYQQIKTNLTFIGEPIQGDSSLEDPQLTSLQATLNLYQQVYLNLLNSLETVKLARLQSTPTVTQIEEAAIPEKPIRPIPLLYIPISGVVGFFIASGIMFLIDYFDDTIKPSQNIQEIFDIPVIGKITESNQSTEIGEVYSSGQINNSLLNAFEILRINVSRLIKQNSLKTILITSSALGEGKTTIAANLAMALTQSGKKTFLLDADLYHPTLHSLLRIDNKRGLGDILADDVDWKDVISDFRGIVVIPGGISRHSATSLLESERMNRLLEELQKEADVVVVDGPPLFIADSQILASKVDGVLLVVRQGGTITSIARAMLNQLKLIGASVIGVVLNRTSGIDTYYFDGYYRDACSINVAKADKTGASVPP